MRKKVFAVEYQYRMGLLDVFHTKKTKPSVKKPSVRLSYRKVYKGTLHKTVGGVTKSGIIKRPRDGKIISLKKHLAGKKSFMKQRLNPVFAAKWDAEKFTKTKKVSTRRTTRTRRA
jgi:hypothetical protein